MTIKKKIFLSIYSLILILTILIYSLVGIVYKRDIESKIINFGTQTIDEMAINMSKNITSTEEILTYKINSTNLFSNDILLYNGNANSKEIKEFVALVGNAGMKVRSCYIKRMNGSEEFWSKDGTKKEFENSMAGKYLLEDLQQMNQNRGTVIWRSFSDAPDSVYLIKNVVEYNTLEKQAILCLQIENTYFHSLESNENLLIVVEDEMGNVLYHSKELSDLESSLWTEQKEDFMSVSASVSKKNWLLIGMIRRNQALTNMRNLLITLIVLELVFLVISFIVSNYISENMTTNIRGLIKNMKKIELGEPIENFPVRSHDETAYLVTAFNDMNEKLQESIEQVTYNRTLKEKAEYNALIAQLNPHFLYNSLASISAMAKLNDQKEIVDAIGNLSKLLRICLSENNAEISLEKELDYVTQYLTLQQLITGGLIEWDIDCEKSLYSLYVPKLILQPIIENCIIHGFAQKKEEAMIVIVARIEENKLVLEVSDNGSGMEQEYADMILSTEALKKSDTDRRHIGVKSIQQRIQYLYGDLFGIKVISEPDNGTMVRLYLPIIRGEL